MDCTKLTGRLRDICEGKSGLPPEVEQQYRDLWAGNPPPAAPNLDCVYRGEHINWVECPTCQNKLVKLKVFACQLHSQCVMQGDVGGVRGCHTCESRLAQAAE